MRDPNGCCKLCQHCSHRGWLKKRCEAFVHDKTRSDCFIGTVKDLTDPTRRVVGSQSDIKHAGLTSGFSPTYRLSTSKLPTTPIKPKKPELLKVVGRSTGDVVTAVMSFSQPIEDVSNTLGDVYIEEKKAFVQSVTSDSKFILRASSEIKTST